MLHFSALCIRAVRRRPQPDLNTERSFGTGEQSQQWEGGREKHKERYSSGQQARGSVAMAGSWN